METGLYANYPIFDRRNGGKRREHLHSGGSKMYILVGVSFGLLCIVQSTLNVCLRLQAVGFFNRSDNIPTSNFIPKSDDIQALILERDQLLQVVDHLNEDKNQLVQEKNKLAKLKEELQVTNRDLTEEMNMLTEKVIHHQTEIDRFQSRILMAESNIPRCPQGWWTYKSSCYQLSSVRDTWQNARQDCESKGAYLVILDDDIEEKVVRSFGAVKMWMGLRCRHSRWMWMDGHLLLPHPSNLQLDCWSPRNCRCANVDGSDLCSETWFIHNCKEHHHWMCEKKPAII